MFWLSLLKIVLNRFLDSESYFKKTRRMSAPTINDDEYLKEEDRFYFDNEKQIKVGNGGKQRSKTDQVNNTRKTTDHTRKICTNLQNFEAKRSQAK